MWGKRQGEGRAIPEGRDFPRATNGWKGRAKALPAEGTGSATVTGLPGIAWTQAIIGHRSNAKPVGLPRCAHRTQGSIPLHARDTKAPSMGHCHTLAAWSCVPLQQHPCLGSVWDSHTSSTTFLKPRFQKSGWDVSMLPAAVTVK